MTQLKPAMLAFFTLSLFSTTWASEITNLPQLSVSDGRFVDVKGAEITLRGFNMSGNAKVPGKDVNNPFMPQQTLAGKKAGDWRSDDYKDLVNMGVNVIRLQFNWEAYESYEGDGEPLKVKDSPFMYHYQHKYNQKYLDYYLTQIKKATDAGIYVLVDIHQDAFSRYTTKGCGEGFPKWVARIANTKFHEPDNSLENCSDWIKTTVFKLGDLIPAFDRLMNPSLIDPKILNMSYMDMLASLTQAIVNKGLSKGIAGYDVMNEPLGLERNYPDFYVQAAQVIRNIDSKAIIFVEPHALTGTGLYPSQLDMGTKLSNMVYAPHYYVPAPLTPFETRFIQTALSDKILTAKWGKAGLFYGEFGTTADNTGLLNGSMDVLYSGMDMLGLSGTQWDYNIMIDSGGWNGENVSVVDGNGNIRSNYAVYGYTKSPAITRNQYLRSHVQRTSGKYGSLKVDYGDLDKVPEITYSWIHNTRIEGSTEIYIPKNLMNAALSAGAKISTWPARITCEYNQNSQKLLCSDYVQNGNIPLIYPAKIRVGL